MTRNITVAALQLALSGSEDENIDAVSALASRAAQDGAQIILPPELFSSPYFCKVEDDAHFALARPVEQHPAVQAMQILCAQLHVAIPTSFFERADDGDGNSNGPQYYNSVAMIGPTGDIMGVYRKSHIPEGPGYEEKYYFRPGNSGFRVWDIFGARFGLGICWDQWFPEAARAMCLMGAEMLLYPTAIGSEPEEPELDTRKMWQRVMVGHAAGNAVPVIAANRIGIEREHGGKPQSFYGHSFICDEQGEILGQLADGEAGAVLQQLDLDRAAHLRASMGFARDRRPDLYDGLIRAV